MKKTVLLVIFLVFWISCFAQEGEIVYVNCYPDEMHPEDPFPYSQRLFDFDGDSINDFFFAWAEYKKWHLIGYSYHDWKFLSDYNLTMKVGDTISSASGYWCSAPADPGHQEVVKIREGTTKDSIFVAFKKPVEDGAFCYGWIRFSIDAGPEILGNWPQGTCTFIDYAYCTRPDYPLRAGQTCFDWKLDENCEEPTVMVHPNPTTGLIVVTGSNLCQVEIYNLTGQLITKEKSQGSSVALDLSAQPAGLYFISVTDQEGRKCVRKVVKE